jgi:hypothetical protein
MNVYLFYLRRAAIALLCLIGIVLLALLIAYGLDRVGFDLIDFLSSKVVFRVS